MNVHAPRPTSYTADCPRQILWLPLVIAFFGTSTVSYADPVISNLDPNSATAGGPSFTLRVNGAEFGGGNTRATVLWNGSARPTTRVNSSQLTAAITAADIATARTVQVRVRVQRVGSDDDDDDNGAETSNQVAFAVNNPIPSIISLSPPATPAGGPAFTLTVNGSNFVAGATVRFAGSSRSTTFVSSSRLTAAIPAADIATAGTASITVLNPGPRTSNALTFTISAPSLTITTGSSLPQGTVGTAYSQTLAASGGTPPYTWSVSSGSLPAGLVLGASNGTISGTPSATGNSSFTARVLDDASVSTTKQFQLTIAAPAAPILNSINPSSTPAGVPAFTLTASGTGFVSSSTVRWNGSNRNTTFVSSSQLTAAIPAADIATPGTASITVLNPGPSTSNALTFTISAPSLTITTGSSLPQGTVGTAYSQTLAASGGTPPYTWSVSSGSLPAGLVLGAPNGTISGTPSATGNSSFTVRVLDNASVSAPVSFNFRLIQPRLPLSPYPAFPTMENLLSNRALRLR